MTFERKCFMSPRDILAVRLRCSTCKATRTIPIDKLRSANLHLVVTRNCPHCTTEFNFPNGTTELEKFVQFNDLLAGLDKLLVGRNFDYDFEVACPQDAD
jgi:hypothetical protein